MRHKLKRLRMSKGLTLEQMSKKLGFKHHSGYYAIEIGRNRLRLDMAQDIAKILEVSIEDLNED